MSCKMSAFLFIFIIWTPTVLTQDSRSSAKHYCYVQSPIDASIFNLTTIQDDYNDSNIRINDAEHLRVHFCRPLKDPCNGKQDYAFCLHSNDNEIGVGKEPPKVAFEFEKIIIKYTGDKCNTTHDYTVDVEMKCNFAIEKLPVDLDVVYHRDECGFQMTIETSAACAKRIQTTCDLKSDSGYFNLSPLIDLTSNYMINLSNTLSVVLNVCHSLIYGRHFSQCDHDSMVCLVDETNIENPTYTRLGNINKDLRISASNGSVYLHLTSDTPCDRDLTGGFKTIRTTIEFVCKEDATNKLPEYVSGLGTCHYKFRWLTIAACSEDILIKHSEANKQPCEITDPVYNNLFYLSMLEGTVTYTNSIDNKAEYQFSVCSPLQKTNCTKSGTGVCKYIKDQNVAVSKGLANTNLMWRSNYVFLNYTDGIACGNYRRSYTTIIFHCNGRSIFRVDDRDPCATIIHWWSPIICNHRCATPDNKMNLQSLSWQSGNYRIEGETNVTEYRLNICEPLVDEGYTNCTYGTGICKVIVNDKGKMISELNLGYPEPGLHEAEDGTVYLRYLNGSVCEEDNSKRISSKLTFICDADAQVVGYIFFTKAHDFLNHMTFLKYLNMMRGIKKFESYSDCHYDFKWRTTHACPKNRATVVQECIKEDKIHVFNLKYLIENSLFVDNRSDSSGYFNASLCDKCNGTFVCDNRSYYGKDLELPITRTKKLVVFELENKSSCKNDTFYNSFLNKWCKLWTSVADSFLLKVVRPERHATEPKEGDNANTKVTPILVIIIVIGVPVAVSLIFIILYFYRNSDKRIMCMECISNVVNGNIAERRESPPAEEVNLQ